MTGAMPDTLDKVGLIELLGSVSEIEHRTLGDAWSGVDALMATHQDFEFESPALEDCSLIELCTAGRMGAEIEFEGMATGAACVYRPGTISFVPAGRPATARSRGGSAEILHLVVDEAILNEIKAEVLCGDPDVSGLLGFNAVHHPKMRFCADALHRELLHPDGGGALMAGAMTQALCVEIVRGYSGGRVSTREPAKATLSAAELNRALDAIEDAVPGDARLDEIAKAIGYSTFHFARAFKATTGTSPHQLLIERRVARARERLEHGSDLIVDIALDCGFSSQAHMTSTFTRRLGVSPGRYRRERRG